MKKIKKHNQIVFEDINTSKQKIKFQSRNQSKINKIFLKYMSITYLFNVILSFQVKFNFSKISLKIKGVGIKFILTSNTDLFQKINYPNTIYINGQYQNEINNSYYFDHSRNYIELIWNRFIPNADHMFAGCSDISKFNFSEFNTSQIKSMRYMFYDCLSLTSIDLSNFDFSQVTSINNIFDGCINLEYINLKNFNGIKLSDDVNEYSNMFNKIKDNITICINKENNKEKILPQIINKSFIIDCSFDLNSKNRKIFDKDDKCLINNKKETNFNFAINKNSVNYFIKNQKIQLKRKLQEAKINNTEFNIFDSISKIDELFGGQKYDDTELYGFEDTVIQKLKPNIVITHTEIQYYNQERNEDSYFNLGECEYELRNYYNISKSEKLYIKNIKSNYSNIDYDVYAKNSSNQFFKLNKYICKSNKIKIVIPINKSIELSDILFKLKYENYETEGKNEIELINYYDEFYQLTERFINKKNFNSSYFENNEVINSKRMNISLTTSFIQNIYSFEESGKCKLIDGCSINKNNLRQLEKIDKGHTLNESIDTKQNNNIIQSIVYLGECENSLRNYYNLSDNETIYMKILDVIQQGMNMTKTEFDVYILNDTNLTKLNISICNKDKVFLIKPQQILEDNIDKVNIKSGYYNDICYATTSESGTDITLEDRKKLYIKENKAVCQDGCDFYGYNYKTGKVFCSCKPKPCPSSIADIYIDKNKLFENLLNIKNITNIDILICYKNLFTKKGIIYNIGSYIIIMIFLFHIFCTIIFYLKKWNILKNKIEDIEFGLKNFKLINPKKKRKKKNNKNIKVKNAQNPNQNLELKISNIKNESIKINNNNDNNLITNNNEQKNINKSNKKILENNEQQSEDLFKVNRYNKNLIEKVINIMTFNENELNQFPYELAKKKDLRTYCTYYISLIKTKHDLIFYLFYNNDYNSKIVKIDLLVVSFGSFYTVNTLFYNNDLMNKIYESNGSFNLAYQLPKIIYSSLISSVLNFFLKFLALPNDKIIEFKSTKSKKNINNKKNELIKQIQIRLILYFIFGFLLLIFFWYSVAMFGAIYKNTQIHLLKDTLISFCLSLFYPFGFYLIPGILRIPSLSNTKKNRKCLYNLSKIF